MSIISQALKGAITWQTAATQIGNWFGQIGHAALQDPVATQAVNDLTNVVKQGASNALALADTSVSAHLGDATTAIETTVDALLAKILGPGAVVASPLVNGGIEQALGILHSTLHEKELEWKAKLAPPPSVAK